MWWGDSPSFGDVSVDAVIINFALSGLLFLLFLREASLAARNRAREGRGLDLVEILFYPSHLNERGRTYRSRALVMLGFLVVSIAVSIVAAIAR